MTSTEIAATLCSNFTIMQKVAIQEYILSK